MKILFSLTYYTPYVSGLTLYVKRLAEALSSDDNQVSVISFRYREELKERETIRGVNVLRAKPLFKISKGFISIDWLIKSWQEAKRADVIFINLPQFEGFWPALFGRVFGKKVIAIYHCEVDLPSGFFNTVIEKLLNISHILTLSLSNIVITYTEDFTRHSKVLSRFGSKIKFVYPPIPVPKVENRVQKILMDKTGLTDSRPGLKRVKGRAFIIGMAARLAAEKGIEYLLEAIPVINAGMQECRNAGKSELKIIIAGPENPAGEENYKKKILKLVEKYTDNIVFLGELGEEDMGSFYSFIDLLVLSSINSTEAFGMVQVEAMMMGVPVVATDLPGVRVPIQKTGMGKIVPIKNSQKLAEAIIEVLLNREKYMKDKDSIMAEFSYKKTVKFYQSLLEKI